jgi:hypothetical protein
MPKRSAEDKLAVPADMLAAPRDRRERKEISRFSDEPTSAPKSEPKRRVTSKEKKTADAEARLSEGPIMERCRAVIDVMLLRPEAAWFDMPVPTEAVPDYLDVITQPMDYSTVRARLDKMEYGEDPLAFAADMRLIFTNAVKCARPQPSPDALLSRAPCASLTQHHTVPTVAHDHGLRLLLLPVRYNWKPDHACHIAARSCLRAFEHYFGRSRGIDSGTPLEDAGSASKTTKSASKTASSAGKKRKSSLGGGAQSASRSSIGGTPGSSAAGGTPGGVDGAPPKKRGRPSVSVADADEGERATKLLRSLAEYLESCGGSESLVDGW